MDPSAEGFAARLAAIHARLDHPPGVMLGVTRLPILDPILEELERAAATVAGTPGSGAPLAADVVNELERLAELFTKELLGTAPEMVQRRVRIVDLVRRSDGGRLPALAADPGDPFGAEVRAMLESDAELGFALGALYPLVARATSVAPSTRWLRDATDVLARALRPTALVEATRRVLAALARAEVVSRPDLLIGGVRPTNQRLARGLLWFASIAFDAPAAALGTVGLRMGTSGRHDAVVRDTALANTSAALLGEAGDPGAPAALATMRSHVTNRNVLKQVDRALEAQAGRAGLTVDELVDLSLPTLGLDARGRLELAVGVATAIIAVDSVGGVDVRWRLADGSESVAPSRSVADAEPAAFAGVTALAETILVTIRDERDRLEDRLASVRSWPIATWRARFAEHPLAGPLGRRLVWILDEQNAPTSALFVDGGWISVDDRAVHATEAARVRLWHPAEATAGERAAWRATVAARGLKQPIRQVDREFFEPNPAVASPTADMRYAGRIVDHPQLRALLRQKGWAVPSLGAWDQGDEATAWRAFEDGLRAELRYQLPDRVATADRVERARIVAVRFSRTDAPAASPAPEGSTVEPVDGVPLRVFSEALRDVSLAVVVGEQPRGA